MWIKDLKDNIKWKFQRAKRGYSDCDAWSVYDWFIEVFSRILGDFLERKNGYPVCDKRIQEDFDKLPMQWVVEQIPKVNKILEKYDEVFVFDDANCQYIMIIMRIKWLIERLDDFHPYWDKYKSTGCYVQEDIICENNEIKEFKKEAFDLLERWFYTLWW